MRSIWLCLFVFATSLAWTIDYRNLNSDLENAKSREDVQRILKQYNVSSEADSALADKAGQATAVPVPDPALIKEIRADVRLRAFASGATEAGTADVAKLKKAKQSPLYNDPGARTEANWLQKSMESFGDWVRGLFDRPQRQTPTANPPNFAVLPEVLTTLVWIVVGAVAVGAGALVIHLISRSRRSVARSKGLLSEEEAKLTLDEWLARADALIAEGRYREAVRCMYVACLLRLDQARALEFRRHETNWEHYHRYTDNPTRPAFELQAPTKEFDLIWYGHRTKGLEDAERFKGYYAALLVAIKSRQAA